MQPPTGNVTFLFTDIEGSTRMWEADRSAMAQILTRHDGMLRATIEQHDGSVFKTVGDGFGAAFDTAHAANGPKSFAITWGAPDW